MIDNDIKKIVLEEGACIVLSKEAVNHNVNFYKKFNTEVGAVVKADSYGCGVANILPVLLENGIFSFFTHNVKEGIMVRENSNNKVDIYILAPIITDSNIALMERYNLIPLIYDIEGLKQYLGHSSSYKKFGLHVETGINRNGIVFDDIDKVKNLVADFEPEIMISHIGCAYQEIHYNHIHNELFEKFKNKITNCKKYSLHASESVFLGVDVYDMLRIGIGILGADTSKNTDGKLKNTVFVFGKVLQIKKVKKGEYVGYKADFVADEDTYIGILNFGYNDGLPRLNNAQDFVSFGKDKMPLIGVTSMDLACFKVPDNLVEELKKEPIVEIFGNNIKIQDIAKNHNMSPSPLEMLTRFKRYPFVVK